VAALTPKPTTERARSQHFWRAARRRSPVQNRRGRPVGSRRSSAPQLTTKMRICRMFSTGATGLEPATSGVTGRARGATNLPRAIRRSLNSGGFPGTASVAFHALPPCRPMRLPHPRPIGASSIETKARSAIGERRPLVDKRTGGSASPRLGWRPSPTCRPGGAWQCPGTNPDQARGDEADPEPARLRLLAGDELVDGFSRRTSASPSATGPPSGQRRSKRKSCRGTSGASGRWLLAYSPTALATMSRSSDGSPTDRPARRTLRPAAIFLAM
jgi:hypothetical protein